MIFPYEIILEIAKYCDGNTIVALTRTCSIFASTRVETDDTCLIPYNRDSFKQKPFNNTIIKKYIMEKCYGNTISQ